ncbi:NlpC/P60 family protein [Dactylosporangium sp. NPDC048998]|uniref:C40 family peptidase n=1 Tax=Dactylosporangium sp. NPDC048998 TaxID=3363976 RepID=UPI00372297C5
MPPRRPRRVPTITIPQRRPDRSRSLARTAAAVLAAVAVLLAGTGAAQAAPTPAELEAQIDEAWNQLEPIIEHYNQIHAQLKENQAKAAALQQQLQPLEAQVDAAMGQVSDLAVQQYKTGRLTTLDALLRGDTPTALLDQLGLINAIARNQHAQIQSVAAARDKLAGDKQALDTAIAQQAQQDADLAAKKKDIEAKLAALQKLRQQAYGSSGGTGTLKPVACPVEYLGGPGGTAAKRACELIGKPYIWGAAGPNGYDCSGLTMAAWAAAGVTLRHYTKWQWDDNKAVSRADLRPGDLVFFYSDLHHMGMYVGGGWMVHAPTTGDYVRMAKLDGRPITGYRRPA